jgi:putative transposase
MARFTLTRADVHRHATHWLQTHLAFADYGCTCPATLLWTILLAAAAGTLSLSAAAHRFRRAPSDETLRKALLANVRDADHDTEALVRQLNAALSHALPSRLTRRRQRVALDLVLVPYHGQPHAADQELYRAAAKGGTHDFHAYATVYVVYRGHRYTVALTPVQRGEDLAAVVRRLLRQATRVGVRPQLVLLDRGFSSVTVIRYLQAARYPFLMPVVCRGRTPDHPKGASGTRVYRTWRRGGWDRYTLTNAQGRKATVTIAVCCVNGAATRGRRRRPRRRGRQALVYACWGIGSRSLAWVRETYRQRFGIETSYRQMHTARARTSSRRPAVRLLYVGIALVLRNVGVWLHTVVLATPRRGGRRLRLERLRFRTLLLWLAEAAAAALGIHEEVATECPVC